jgi:hypothetical protein
MFFGPKKEITPWREFFVSPDISGSRPQRAKGVNSTHLIPKGLN